MPNLEQLKNAAQAAEEPGFTTRAATKFGGVDPLGLRQINFNLMDEVLPGLNNVARHIKPFVVVAWAWRRAQQRAQARGGVTIKQEELQDFVDRIEVLFALSQFLRNKDADLPGSQYLAPWLRDAEFKFGGPKWQQRRKERRYSTSLSAPINYGPGLKMLGWIMRHPEFPNVMIPNPATSPALDALEEQIAGALDHEAFNDFGSVSVARDDARNWGDLWAIDSVSDAEARVVADLLIGAGAPVSRREGGGLMLAAVDHLGGVPEHELVRAAMAGPPAEFEPAPLLRDSQQKWRLLQLRQLFRLSLEAFFFWTMRELDGPKRSIDSLVKSFASQVPVGPGTAGEWLQSLLAPEDGPTELMARIEQALDDPQTDDLPECIVRGLALTLTEQTPDLRQQYERLPLSRAQKEALARSASPVDDFVRHVLESWVLAQHTYWSVGRGLADARARGRMLLRLRIILAEGGWTLTPGASVTGRPRPTADRLQTALTLADECGLLAKPDR